MRPSGAAPRGRSPAAAAGQQGGPRQCCWYRGLCCAAAGYSLHPALPCRSRSQRAGGCAPGRGRPGRPPPGRPGGLSPGAAGRHPLGTPRPPCMGCVPGGDLRSGRRPIQEHPSWAKGGQHPAVLALTSAAGWRCWSMPARARQTPARGRPPARTSSETAARLQGGHGGFVQCARHREVKSAGRGQYNAGQRDATRSCFRLAFRCAPVQSVHVRWRSLYERCAISSCHSAPFFTSLSCRVEGKGAR